ncbi:MAG TPA: protein-L-isoaspartate O-methyltransferase [Steroidobacteraceae bacterium]|jgi:protein-L-isoaspartate(D-aspartate) O-methyltransferase|nr:protein-L-isoaspartate O-methyltransferase [Steroidobacteraceae bacterium]
MSTNALEQMVEQQVRAWDVLDDRILDAMRAVPREPFVPRAWRSLAYADCEIALAGGKRMLRPMLVGRILQSLELRPGERVLEVGTGSGYLTACLARLGARVRSLELHEPIAAQARENLATLGAAAPVEVLTADAMDLTESSAYDAIVLTASLPVYQPLFEQALRPGGRMFVVIGAGEPQQANLVRRVAQRDFAREPLFETVIEPLEHAPSPPTFGF